uniref:MFS domain-containing protein n=1 Tax=Meloidogyne hapla TaxID=6305 RepID=A0A1I8BBX6_MELHA
MAIAECSKTAMSTTTDTSTSSTRQRNNAGSRGEINSSSPQLNQHASDDEEKCLLTPTSLAGECCASFSQSDTDLLQRQTETIERERNQQNSSNKNNYLDISSPPNLTILPDIENEYSSPSPQQYFLSTALIYSEPALPSAHLNDIAGQGGQTNLSNYHWAYSDLTLSQSCATDTIDASISNQQQTQDNSNINSARGDKASRATTPKSSSCLFSTESQPSISTSIGYLPHKQSFSIGEIRDTHLQIQKRYRPSKKRHYTDPVDFEGILNIIGGCSWWQIWVYLLISLQQIPHAMFNLSVVYMMYQPDHWCKVPGVNSSFPSPHPSSPPFSSKSPYQSTTTSTPKTTTQSPYLWDLSDALQGSVVYPRTRNKQRDTLNFHSQCHFYDRGEERYDQLRRMPLDEAQKIVNESGESPDIVKCQEWYYDQDVLRSTIVTEWNLVCDDNFKRAHAHLFYSFGFLFGCLLGGFASDRFGRKPTVIGFGILSSLFGLLLPYSTYFPMFLFIRFCGAVCNEAADLAAYVLCMEITGTRYRAMVGSLLQAPWAVGYATLALIAYFCKSWQNIQLITAALHTISICLICVLPESPRWLIVNNRVDEAENYIRRACRKPPFPFNLFDFNKSSLPSDLELVKHAEQRKWVRRDQRANILHLLKSRALCMRTGVICIVWIATALVYYGLIIALSDQSAPGRVLFSGNFFLNNAIAGAIELPTLIFCVYLMKFGRKRSQIFTLVGAALFIILAMCAMNLGSPMLSLGLMLGGKIFIQGGFNILYIFTSELYPTIARFGSGVSSYIAILSDVTLAFVPMIIFATFSLFAGTLVMLLPETRDQPLPDTLQDAVTILKDDSRPYQCHGFGSIFLGTDKYSISITELVQHQNEEETEEEQQTERDENSECDDRNGGGTSEVDESINNDNNNDENNTSPKNDKILTNPRKRSTENGMSNNNEQIPLPSIPEEDHHQLLQQKPSTSSQNFIENEEIPLICLKNRKNKNEEQIKKENKILMNSSNNLCENEIISPLTSHSEFSLLMKDEHLNNSIVPSTTLITASSVGQLSPSGVNIAQALAI